MNVDLFSTVYFIHMIFSEPFKIYYPQKTQNTDIDSQITSQNTIKNVLSIQLILQTIHR